jgi:hypothetical protein
MIHTRGKSGTFGEHLTSEWCDEKCRIYEINHMAFPSLYDENAGKFQIQINMVQMSKIAVSLNCDLS